MKRILWLCGIMELFNNLSTKFTQLLYGRSEDDLLRVNQLLESLNQLDYRYPIVTNQTKAVLLIHKCCSLIPTNDVNLVSKCCQLITNLINRQQVQVERQTLTVALQWCLQAVNEKNDAVIIDVLVVLDALIRSNGHNSHIIYLNILRSNSPILSLVQDEKDPEIILLALQCLEACTSISDETKTKRDRSDVNQFFQLCTEIFLRYLTSVKFQNFDDLLYCKLLICCLKGLRNISNQNEQYLHENLGVLLGICKSYIVHGIKGVEFILPTKILPSSFSIMETAVSSPVEKKGGKIAKQRKHKNNKKVAGESVLDDSQFHGYVPATLALNSSFEQVTISNCYGRLRTSDSDFSDTESGRMAKLGIMQGRVRQTTLNFLFDIIRLTDKRTIFSYWSSLIPDASRIGAHNLSTCILKDPSQKGRIAAANVLLALLTSSKTYLFQAEINKKETGAFTSFSAILGSMVTELHRWLLLALNENFVPVLIQILKCLAALVQATPYHRLQKGLITKLIRNTKQFIGHKDAKVQVAALILFGCILSSEPTIIETKELFLKRFDKGEELQSGRSDKNDWLDRNEDYVDFSSEDESDKENCTEMPWLLEICLKNLGVTFEHIKKIDNVPAPVKLECLQVLSAMTRNYFDCLMVPYLPQIVKSIDISMGDKYLDLRLHAGKSLDFIGQAINTCLINQHENILTIEQALVFWQTLISGSLTRLLESEQHSSLKAVGCDCIGSIGQGVFEQLSRDKQILLVTLLFSCSRDKENCVKAASVRALGICVMYPSLREDSGFVMDVAEAVTRTLKDENMDVRVKSSWSLGNLSDALVINKFDPESEDIPDGLLLRLLEIAIKSDDNDKIKVNAVRALGNFLHLITSNLLNEKSFRVTGEQAIQVLVKNSTSGCNMKVRWNSCYAIGNMLKNSDLYTCNDSNWQEMVFDSLCDLVINFRNFKVRINAALALSSPKNRRLYGHHFDHVWTGLLKALDNTENMEDFTEYKHRDHLVNQICLTLGHMTTLLSPEDLLAVQDNIVYYFDIFRTQMHKVLDRLLPEKSTVLLTASSCLANLLTKNTLTVEQKKVVFMLKEIFINPSI